MGLRPLFNSMNIFDFNFYAKNFLKIKTKTDGIKPFELMPYQDAYIKHLKNDFKDGIIRSIVVKGRQAGFSTLIAGYNTHRACTEKDFKTIMLADKSGRTDEVFSIYRTFIYNLPSIIRPMMSVDNEREIVFDNPDQLKRNNNPGLGSSIQGETANDKAAGRAGTRKSAHMTEVAFMRYGAEVHESVANSIPLHKGTYIVQESTCNGVSGDGEYFYNLWNAAVRGDTIYKPYFVPWFSIQNYQMKIPMGFIATKTEKDLMLRCPEITEANLVWRRYKILEYSGVRSVFTPEERFCADFPSYPEEGFLSTGRPVFDQNKLKIHIQKLDSEKSALPKIRFTKEILSQFASDLTIYEPPKPGVKYVIGADVALGLADGDFSTAYIMTNDLKQVGKFKSHIDPDIFGKLLVELAKIYNNALLVPEINNMGISTLSSIKNEGYLRIYQREVFEELTDRDTEKLGWITTVKSKQQMLSNLIGLYRDNEVLIKDIDLLREMLALTREDDGNVNLNGKDMTVAACLACMGANQIYEAARVIDPHKKIKLQLETKDLWRDSLKKG